ncbi:MAG: nucleotide exchange factor GrpE [Lachnospiraceae bacterium]|nr:nucleotide exchange factor GrpE [Lachnospiraceae bacterium]
MAEFEEKDLEQEAVAEESVEAEASVNTEQEEAVAQNCEPAEDTIEQDTSEEAGEEGEQASSTEKKSFFKKKEKKDKKDEQIAQLTDQVKRTMAEFDNYRKRTEKEKSAMYEIGAKAVIEKMLPIVDNFERGLGALSEEEKGTGFAEGMERVYKQLMTALTEIGVEPIEAVGKEFDPNLHNAVMHMESEEFGENTVAQEFQKGYTYKGSVVRHSMVQVAN